jgi:hypothetical protein
MFNPVFKWFMAAIFFNHSKTGHFCPVFEWTGKLDHFIKRKNYDWSYIKGYNASGTFENRTRNRMVKDHLKTGQKLCPENEHSITVWSCFWMATVNRRKIITKSCCKNMRNKPRASKLFALLLISNK